MLSWSFVMTVFGVLGLGGVQQVDAQLLLLARAALEVERFRLVELTHHAGKHAVESDFCHKNRCFRLINDIFLQKNLVNSKKCCTFVH